MHVMNKEAVFLNLPDKLAFLRVERFAKIRKLELQGLKLYKMTEESWSTLYEHVMNKEAVFVNHLNLAAVDRNVKMNRKKGHDTKIVSYHSNFFFIL